MLPRHSNAIPPPICYHPSMPPPPKIVILAGPKGAGKTTFAQAFLPNEAHCPDFLNADLIARGLSPFNPEKAALRAGKLLLEEIARRIAQRKSFAFETTLSGQNYARHIPLWRKQGYYVTLIFLSLLSADLAVARVKARVKQGGHDVPEAVIRRRFDAGLINFDSLYKPLAGSWAVYDSSFNPPRPIAAGDNP
jgi:predicted ABC-type ATPase